MSTPLVSVITTVRNCERFIEESLRSIFNQTFKDFEFIVFDDASTDQTRKIIDKTFRDFNGAYTITNRVGKNIGCGAGRNEAIHRARGKYIAIHDGDDVSYSGRLEKEVAMIEANPDLFCVGAWSDLINASGKNIGHWEYPPSDHNGFIKQIYKVKNPIIDPTTLFRSDIFQDLGGYDTKWFLIPDYHLWVIAMLNGHRFANVQERLIAHRRHDGSIMWNEWRSAMIQHRMLYKSEVVKRKKEVFLV